MSAERKERCGTCRYNDSTPCDGDTIPQEVFDREWEKLFEEGKDAGRIARELYELGHMAGRNMTRCGQWKAMEA